MSMERPRTVQVGQRYQAPEADLCECGRCGSQLVQPLAMHRYDACWWYVERRCPECDWTSTDRVHDRAVARLDEELDAGRASMVALLRAIERNEMERDVECFAHALVLDHVLPEDF
jgi:hypothetical protein